MTTKELIRAEIERMKQYAEESKMEWVNEGYNQNAFAEDCRISSFDKLLSFLDTLPDESEQPTRGYDEAYLNEKIAKASKSWEGVDVDKFMDEIRGREPVTDCHDLEEAAKEYATTHLRNNEFPTVDSAFRAGAEWMKRKMISALKNDGDLPIEFIDKFHEIDRTAFQNGQANMRAKMMEGAAEGVVWGNVGKNINISVLKGACKYLEQDDLPYKVRIIILPKE